MFGLLPLVVWVGSFALAAIAVWGFGFSAGVVASIAAYVATVVSIILQAGAEALGGSRLWRLLSRLAVIATALAGAAYLIVGNPTSPSHAAAVLPLAWPATAALSVYLLWLRRGVIRRRCQHMAFNQISDKLKELDESWIEGAENSKYEAALLAALRGLRDTLYKGAVHSILSPLQRCFPRAGVITLYYLEPSDPPGEPLEIAWSVYSGHTPLSAIEGCFTWISENYRPAAFDEATFNALMELSSSGKDPREHFLSLSSRARSEVVSAAGFVSRTQQPLRALLSRRDLYFDHHLSVQLKAAGFERADRLWAEVRSFVAVPVPTRKTGDVPVVLAVSTAPCAFTREDQEWSKTVALILSQMAPRGAQEDAPQPAEGVSAHS